MPAVASPALASKEAVLKAAQVLLANHGYAGLSMRELARQCGLAKATIYHHFQDKDAIYFSVIERDIAVVCQQMTAASTSAKSWDQRLSAIVRTYFQLQQERRGFVLAALRDGFGNKSQVCALAKRYRDELIQPIADVLKEGMDLGYVRPINAEMAAISLLGIMNGFIAHRIVLEESVVEPEVIDYTLQIFYRGVSSEASSADTW